MANTLRIVAAVLTLVAGAAVLAGCDPQPPKDNSNVHAPPPPPPPGGAVKK